MAPQHETYKCPICQKNVTKTQKSIGCACCGLFFHTTCAKISPDEFNFMAKHKTLKFICGTCPSSSHATNIQEELKKGFSTLSTTLEKEFNLKLEEYKRILQEKLDAAVNIIKMQIDELVKQCTENKLKISELKSDIKNCYKLIKQVDDGTESKIHTLEMESNTNQRRLNRSNIIIRGLPKNIINLREPIVKIGSLCEVAICNSDIQHCTYFGGDKAVLVKFNSVQLRDQIMINYHKSRQIILKDVIGGDIESRVYLNDHLTFAAKKVVAVCRDLRHKGKIKRYTHLNYDVPKVRIEFNDGNIKILNYDQCLNILNETPDPDDSNQPVVGF